MVILRKEHTMVDATERCSRPPAMMISEPTAMAAMPARALSKVVLLHVSLDRS